MYNLHCHSLLSDGYLLPSELAMRYLAAGYKAIAITDHADFSNIRSVIPAILSFCRHWPASIPIKVLPGVELTHLPPEQFKPLARMARKLGADIIIGHGETPAEPVAQGTNRAALESGIDILAHPGFILEKDVLLAKEKGICLEITSRRGHKAGNAHVAQLATAMGAPVAISHDSHAPDDIISPEQAMNVALESGLTREQAENAYKTMRELIKKRSRV